MQSGTLLHLALLRKISHQTPTPHKHHRVEGFNRGQSLKNCQQTCINNDTETAHPLI